MNARPDYIDNLRWDSAVRLSYILNEVGEPIPIIAGQTVSGADMRQYFFRVRDLMAFLTRRWGKAETVKCPSSSMMNLVRRCLSSAAFTSVFAFTPVHAQDSAATSPQAPARTYAQNYKDMVLATCIANAYAKDGKAGTDAGSSVSALRDWTYYDLEASPEAVKSLVDRYLARNYHNPLAESEVKGVRFDLLKCLDLYHGKELDSLAKRVVINPKQTYRQEISRSQDTQK